jgi:hypothetical protein
MEKFERKHSTTLASRTAMKKGYATPAGAMGTTFYIYNLKYVKT